MDLDLHVGAELSRCDLDPPLTQRIEKAFIEWNGVLRACRIDERGTASLCRIAIQCELRDHQHRSPCLCKSKIHFPVSIAEEPEPGDLLGHPVYLRRRVSVSKPDEQAEASADCTSHAPFDRDRRS